MTWSDAQLASGAAKGFAKQESPLQEAIYIMSATPPKETDVEQGAPSPDNSEHMDRGEAEAQARELAYEFEVKEQDRWLPIANGWFFMHHCLFTKTLYFKCAAAWRRSAPNGVASGSGSAQKRVLLVSFMRTMRSAPAYLSLLSMVNTSQPVGAHYVPRFPAVNFTSA